MSTVPPPIAPVALSVTGQPFAGFWIRAAAMLLDMIPLAMANTFFLVLFGTGIGELLGLLAGIGYFTYFTGGKWQATPGKRIVGIHVMRTDGATITYQRALGRYFSYIVSWVILAIGFIMVAFTVEKTGLHDLICDTRVVYGKR